MANIQMLYLTLCGQICGLTAVFSDCGSWSFLQVPANNDYILSTGALDIVNETNVASCVGTCLNHEQCASAIFNTDICYLYQDILDLNPAGEYSQGALYYQITEIDECSEGLHNCPTPSHACHDTLRSFTCVCAHGFTGDGITCTAMSLSSVTCTSDADCPTPNSRCLSSICECQLGYHYNPGEETCVAACSAYSSEFTRQVTGQCFGSGGTAKGERGLSSCKTVCVDDGPGTCRVVQMSDGDCTIFHTTYLETQTGWGQGECTYYQRDCA